MRRRLKLLLDTLRFARSVRVPLTPRLVAHGWARGGELPSFDWLRLDYEPAEVRWARRREAEMRRAAMRRAAMAGDPLACWGRR